MLDKIININEDENRILQLESKNKELIEIINELQAENEKLNYKLSESKLSDVTQMESLGMFFTILHSSPFAIVLHTFPEGNIIEANSNFYKLFNLDEKDIIGVNYAKLPIWKKDSDYSIITKEVTEIGYVSDFEIVMQNSIGVSLHIVITAKKLDLFGKNCLVEILQDETPKKEREVELKLLKEAADEANRLKSEFLANMSHEIRTPMNAILGFSELLIAREKDEKNLEYANIILNSGKNLLMLLNDILDLSKIEAGRMELQFAPIDLKSIFNEIKHIFLLKAKEKKITIDFEIDAEINGSLILDETRLRQVMLNLVGNSIKFTDSGYVIFRAKINSSDSENFKVDLVIEVTDTGIGIPENQINIIFEAFRQQSGQSQKVYGGTGLGLTITKRLVEMMGGSISVTSQIGKGSTFKIYIPNIKRSEEQIQNNKDNKNQELTNNIKFNYSNILVVDDTEVNRKLVKEFLKDYNVNVIEAGNGKEALEKIEQYMPSVVLMDLKMPEMDGYEATIIIKKNEKTNQIPVIALTASAMSNEESKIWESGFDDYVKKPVNKLSIIKILMNYIEHTIEETEESLNNNTEEANELQLQKNYYEKYILDNSLIEKFENEFMETSSKLQKTFVIGSIKKFGESIAEIGTTNNIQFITDYGKSLIKFTETLALDKISEALKNYPDFVERIRNSTN